MARDAPSDGRLLQAWRRGDEHAFGALVARHQAALLRHARAMLGDWRGGEDVVQETFLRLARTPPEVPADGLAAGEDPAAERALLAAWLHRVTRNLCMDTVRSETRRRAREEVVAPRESVTPPAGALEREDLRAAVERSLSRLPADQREVLTLRLLAERSYREISAITGRNVGTVGWLVSVGMKRLAKELAPLVGRDEAPERTAQASLRGGAR